MKIAISYPPLVSTKGRAFLSQNRQFQWTHTNNVIYPVVPAYAATMLQKSGHSVLWDDANAQLLHFDKWIARLNAFSPDVIFFETKTPVVKRHWKLIDIIKRKMPNVQVILAGDHVTAFPAESFENCAVDFVLTGGDYDFLLLNLVNHFSNKEKLEGGIYYRKNNNVECTGKFVLNHDLCALPIIDRRLTRWKDYSINNSNYKYLPGAYTMAARDCWWGKCTFCSWTTLYPGAHYRCNSPIKLLDEIGILSNNFKVKEIMDDSGSFPTGEFLDSFCRGMIKRGYNKKIKFDCNFRFNAVSKEQFFLMRKAGFRFILFGLESAQQSTLEHVNKNIKIEYVERDLTYAKKAGLDPHITVMVGYPWESKQDASNTLDFAKQLFRKGLLDSLQATIVVPYPGTPLFEECRKNNWLKTEDWDEYDMSKSVMKCHVSDNELKGMVKQMYKGAFYPGFIARKILSVRNYDDVKHLMRYGVKFLKKLRDF
ncbi:MAG: cobalamin-dependent protein [archaeon]